MRQKGIPLTVALLAGLAFDSSVMALESTAPASRVFVNARTGYDANSCANIKTPCLTFAGAVSQLAPFGSVIVLGSGDYGPVTITQSLTIETAPGVTAYVRPATGNGITINAGPSDLVVLRGLTISAGLTGQLRSGIRVNSVGVLHVESCVIGGTGFYGLLFESDGALFLTDTIVRDFALGGINVGRPGGSIQVQVDGCRFEHNGVGFLAQSGTASQVRNSSASGNQLDGFVASGGSDTAELVADHCMASGNGESGFVAELNSTMRVANSTASQNGGYGFWNRGGPLSFESLGNNFVRGNLTNTQGPILVVSGQ